MGPISYDLVRTLDGVRQAPGRVAAAGPEGGFGLRGCQDPCSTTQGGEWVDANPRSLGVLLLERTTYDT